MKSFFAWLRKLFGFDKAQQTPITDTPPLKGGEQGSFSPTGLAYPIIYGKRDSVDITLNVIKGALPKDMYGYMYWTVPGGSVNSQGLPYPETNPDGSKNKEYGSPLMVSDGLVFKLGFNQGSAQLQTQLMNSPCLIADEATGIGGAAAGNDEYAKWGFTNLGMIRNSLHLGLRNLLNTAVVPFQFETDDSVRTLVTYDLGRPFEMDPANMALMTPIGANTEWKSAMPSFLKNPFPMIQSTAHPSFDPNTKELFTVNYTRTMDSILGNTHLIATLMHEPKVLEKHLEKLAKEFEEHKNADRSTEDLQKLLDDPVNTMDGGKSLEEHFEGEDISHMMASIMPSNEVYLMRWDGQQGPLKQWKVVYLNDEGKEASIGILQCMHQTQVTRDYILLSDSNFKTSLSIMVNNPFPNNELIDRWLRHMLAAPMEPYLQLYIVKRSDLDDNSDTVRCVKMPKPIPMESVHYSVNYENPNNELKLFMSVNASACMAEWLRTYDLEAVKNIPHKVLRSMLGMFAVGTVDINQIGRYVVNGETGEIVEDQCKTLAAEGNTADPANVGAHTWQLGLYTYRDIISPTHMVNQIDNLYTLSFGLDPRTLTKYVYDLYKDKPGNTVPAGEVRDLSKVLQTHALVNVETDDMTVADYYQFDQDVNPRSIQFVPKKDPTPGVNPQRDGYIVCSMNVVTNPEKAFEDRLYRPEIWIFDANDLGQQRADGGPICRLDHPDMNWGYGLHSVWLEDAVSPGDTGYNIDVKEDINTMIDQYWLPGKRAKAKKFFEEYVYPKWYAQKPN